MKQLQSPYKMFLRLMVDYVSVRRSQRPSTVSNRYWDSSTSWYRNQAKTPLKPERFYKAQW